MGLKWAQTGLNGLKITYENHTIVMEKLLLWKSLDHFKIQIFLISINSWLELVAAGCASPCTDVSTQMVGDICSFS